MRLKALEVRRQRCVAGVGQGRGAHRQPLPPPPTPLLSLPTAPQNIKIRFVASGPAATHAVLGGAGGTLYALGRNDRGQLGLGDLCTRNVPTAITLEGAGDGVPVAAACGKAHTLVVLSSGAALAAGANGAGQLGTGSLPKAKAGTPEECVKTFVRSRVDGVATAAAGIDFSAWLGADGSVWTAGSPQYGQLGHGTDGSYNAKESSIKARPGMGVGGVG